MKMCKVEGCNGKHVAKGYCKKHYQQYKRHGHIIRTIYDPNEIIEYDDCAEIVLYDEDNEEVARALIDLEDVELVKHYKWCLNGNGYVRSNKAGYLHRFLMNPSEDMVVDHISHNTLDNRKDNLRICTLQQNNWNMNVRDTNTSGHTGVCFDNRRNKWFAQIFVNGKYNFLGYYENKQDAINTRKQAEILYFGEYAPEEEE